MPSTLRNKLHKFSHKGLQPGSTSAYFFALACVAIAATTNFAFLYFINDITLSIAYYPAIFIATLFGGVRAGILVVVVCASVLWWTDTEYFGNRTSLLTQFVNFGLYIFSATLIVWVANLLRHKSNNDQQRSEMPSTPGRSVVVQLVSKRLATDNLRHKFRLLWREGLHPNSLAAHTFSLAFVTFATVIRFGFGWFGNDILPFACYYPMILIASLIGGIEAGLVATALSLIVVGWAFVPPYYSIGLPTPDQVIDCELFVFVSMLSVWLIERHRYATVRTGRGCACRTANFYADRNLIWFGSPHNACPDDFQTHS